MLTVGPALAALAAEGTLPSLRGNKFCILRESLVQARPEANADDADHAPLHVLNMGYVQTGPPGTLGPENFLVVCSEDLLAPPQPPDAAARDPLQYEMTYAVRKSQRKTCEEEMLLPDVLTVPKLQ